MKINQQITRMFVQLKGKNYKNRTRSEITTNLFAYLKNFVFLLQTNVLNFILPTSDI